ncbi:hypothetical protein [Xanthomonas sacchari]|uniref:hypothetical protein n=1 Tax=Xanthomonas sacchari TaxID=56458 RepID=UPI002435B214|nr:hypothetical protein [Xanthomonas sacchari]
MAGRRQHYIPRFLQRGFLAERTDDAERTWLHRKGVAARLVVIRDVGVGEYFYSKLSISGEETLDDLITSLESSIQADISAIRQVPLGGMVDPTIPARITTHLTLRTAHVRSVFLNGTAQILEKISELSADSGQMRDLLGLDSIDMGQAMSVIDQELKSSQLDQLLPRPFARRAVAFWLRESFNESYASYLPVVLEALDKLGETLPSAIRDAHNSALRTAKTTRWEEELARLYWRTHRVVGAILPDCIALSKTGEESFVPLILKEHTPDIIILPIAHDLLLVGSSNDSIDLDIGKINEASAACSDNFFIARHAHEAADLAGLIGQRCSLAIKRLADEALVKVRPGDVPLPIGVPDNKFTASVSHANSFSFSVSCLGFGDAEIMDRLGTVMQAVAHEVGRDLPLSTLDGVTFASDYAGALENLDRGDPTLQPDKTRPRIYGQAVAKCVHVIREGIRKEHIVFDACIAKGLLEATDEGGAWALHILVIMLANVAHGPMYEQRLPVVPSMPFDIMSGRLHVATGACPGRYFAARTSAFADSNAGERYATLCVDSLLSARQEIRTARQAYLDDQNMDLLLDAALMHVSSFLDHAAEWLGHRDGRPTQELLPGGWLPESLKVQGLQDWLELFGYDLRRLYDGDDQFTVENILALSRHVERLLWTMGMFPWPTDDGQLYVSLGPISDLS